MREEPEPESDRPDDGSGATRGAKSPPLRDRLLGWLFYAAAFAAVLLALRVMGFPILSLIGE